MTTFQGNYAKHAAVWDWSGYERSDEFQFWYQLATKYGKNILSAMAALGEVGAYMAERDMYVTALDYTKEMIEEGQRRFQHLSKLEFIEADVRYLEIDNKEYDFAFIGSTDLHHMLNETDVKLALSSIKSHLRDSGGLGLELWYPSSKSWSSPKRRFEQLKQKSDIKVWKEGATQYDAQTKRVKISQQVYIQQGEGVEQFSHEFEMQLYSRESIFSILNECGFMVVAEYGDYQSKPWSEGASKWILECVKS